MYHMIPGFLSPASKKGHPEVDFLDLFLFILFDEEKPAGMIVLSDIVDRGDFPLLAEGSLVDPALDFMVILEVSPIQVYTF